jgi:putative ABC transport system substrate-binding protein
MMTDSKRAWWLAILLIGVLLPSGLPRAEASTTLSGSVNDTQGRPLEGARVTLSGRGVRTSHLTTEFDGGYRFPALRGGTPYVLTIEREGYGTITYEGLQLESGRARLFDVRLRRPGEREVVVLASRDPFPYEELIEGLDRQLDLPLRVHELDDDPNPEETVRRVRAERPNLIIAAGLRAARLVRREVREIPSILTLISDPRRYDLESANICFVTNHPSPDDLAARLSALLPEARRIGLVYDARDSAFVARDMRRSLRARRMNVEMRPCYHPDEIEEVLDKLLGRVDALVVPYDPLMAAPGISDRVIAWALRQRVPLAAPDAGWVQRGALFSHGVTPATLSFDVAWVASQILFHGRQPIDFGVRNPANRVLAVNEGTAFALGIEIPADLEFDLTY